jgi:hypothetical protein
MTNNPKTRTLRKLLDEEGGIVLLIYGSEHNEQAEDTIHPTERIPPQDLSKWLATKAKALPKRKMEYLQKRNEKKKQSGMVQRYRETRKEGPSKNFQKWLRCRKTRHPGVPFLQQECPLWTCGKTEQKRREMKDVKEY